MVVSVYPQLDALLRARGLSLTDLQRAMEERYGRAVDVDALQSLAGSEPVEHTDIALAGAIAAVLGIKLDDLFTVELDGDAASSSDTAGFPDEQPAARLRELLDRQIQDGFTAAEQRELEALVEERLTAARVWIQQAPDDPDERRAFIERERARRAR